MWIELDYRAETLEEAICRAIVAYLGYGMPPREILDQLIGRALIRNPGNNALQDVVQELYGRADAQRSGNADRLGGGTRRGADELGTHIFS
jgi:hypothetical protein